MSVSPVPAIGFVGLGTMGGPMCHRLLNAGYTITAFDIDQAALDLGPGDLQIFRGRHSLHRVTRIPEESAPRHAAIFAYTGQPDVIGRVARAEQLFGRVLPGHLDAENDPVRSDALID